MLHRRQPVTLRSVVEGLDASTMAVYTHFNGMAGLWRAVRQEGFERLARRLAQIEPTKDPVFDLVVLGTAYTSNALANPHLFRAMFDTEFDLDDPTAASRTFDRLVASAARAQAAGRFDADETPEIIATRYWVMGHGLTGLVVNGVLPVTALNEHVPSMTVALFTALGDDAARCRRSVVRGWSQFAPPA
jgi:AcrR family transcriptional regulator